MVAGKTAYFQSADSKEEKNIDVCTNEGEARRTCAAAEVLADESGARFAPQAGFPHVDHPRGGCRSTECHGPPAAEPEQARCRADAGVLKPGPGAGPVAWAPSDSKRAYVVGFDRTFYRSIDGGLTWQRVS